jgi:ubiquitin-like 1-activating enzyme E1 A
MASLTEQDAEIYDRQIRLWGVEAQQRLQSSRVLMAGTFSTTSAEISKNLVLAGFSAGIIDPNNVAPEDLGSNFLLREEHIGRSRALSALANLQELNPMVSVTAMQQPTSVITMEFITNEKYNVVVLSGPSSLSEINRINGVCRESGAAFFFVDMYGFLGVGFSDLGDQFSYRSGSVDLNTDKITELNFTTLGNALNTPWLELSKIKYGVPSFYFAWHCILQYMEHNNLESLNISHLESLKTYGNEMCTQQQIDRSLLDNSMLETLMRCHACDVGAACAIMGGLLGQEIVKSIARKSEPFQNVFFLDAMGNARQSFARKKPSKGGIRVVTIPPSLREVPYSK